MGNAPTDNDSGRPLGLVSATAIVIATIIGSGIFTTTGQVGPSLVSEFNVYAVWIVCAILSLCGALTMGELGAMLPRSGGGYAFVNRGIGPRTSSFIGLQILLLGYPISIAIIALVMGGYLNDVLPWCPAPVAAALVVVVITLVNCRSTMLGAGANNLGTALKILIIGAFIAGGLWVAAPGTLEQAPTETGPTTAAPGLLTATFAAAVSQVMFAFNGWGAVTVVGGEVRNPHRNLPIAILLALGVATLLYMLINMVFLRTAHPTAMLDVDGNPTTTIGYFAAERLFPIWVADLLTWGIVVLLLSTLLSVILTGGRWGYAMSRHGQLPAIFGERNRGGAPVAALILQAVISLGLLLSASIGTLLILAGVTGLLCRSIIISSVFALRIREPGLARPFRVPLYPITPLVFIVASVWIGWQAAMSDRAILVSTLVAIGLTALPALVLGGRRTDAPA